MNKVDKAIDVLLSEDEPLFSNPLVFDDKWLTAHVITVQGDPTATWTRREDGKIDVDGSLNFNHRGIDEIPFDFGIVTGDFSCARNDLRSLKGSPEKVGRWFNCTSNQLTTLEGGPKEVGGRFRCEGNPLTSLKGAPEKVGNAFISNKFTDKEYRDYVKEIHK